MFGNKGITVRATRNSVIAQRTVKAGDEVTVDGLEAAAVLQTGCGVLVSADDQHAVTEATRHEQQLQARQARAWRHQ